MLAPFTPSPEFALKGYTFWCRFSFSFLFFFLVIAFGVGLSFSSHTNKVIPLGVDFSLFLCFFFKSLAADLNQ